MQENGVASFGIWDSSVAWALCGGFIALALLEYSGLVKHCVECWNGIKFFTSFGIWITKALFQLTFN